jgi:methyl-accepting chemotaxis protein
MAKEPYTLARKIYAIAIGLGGYGLLLWGLLYYPLSAEDWLYTLALAALCLLFGMIGALLPGRVDLYVGLEGTAYYAAMLVLNPWAAALVAVVAPYAHWVRRRQRFTPLAVFRNGGMYALMGLAGAGVYRAVAGPARADDITGPVLLGLALALVAVRVVNEVFFFGGGVLAAGMRATLQTQIRNQPTSWAVEAAGYLPALLTALVYVRIGWAALILWLALLIAGALGLYLLVRVRRELNQRLIELGQANAQMTEHEQLEAELAVSLHGAAEELAGYAARLAAALQQQHVAVSEITATIEELARQAGYIADTAGIVDSTSEAALQTAGRGREAAAGSVQAMADLEQNVRAMNERMSALEDRSRLVRRTLQTINNIASETHLLALNATIEAAGAGERGRRFSIVAQQINALADQALQAASEIQVTVREIESATGDTKQVIEQGLAETRRYTGQVDEARRSMEVIVGAVGRASDMAQQIRLATQQQTQASSQVTGAMREIAASMGSASAEGTAVSSAAAHLRRLAVELRHLDISLAPEHPPPPNGH